MIRIFICTLAMLAAFHAPRVYAQQNMADVVYGQGAQNAGTLFSTIPPEQNRSQVSAVQHELQACGYKVKVDGAYGPKTRAAVRKFQKKNGLEQSGMLDSATLRALGISDLY